MICEYFYSASLGRDFSIFPQPKREMMLRTDKIYDLESFFYCINGAEKLWNHIHIGGYFFYETSFIMAYEFTVLLPTSIVDNALHKHLITQSCNYHFDPNFRVSREQEKGNISFYMGPSNHPQFGSIKLKVVDNITTRIEIYICEEPSQRPSDKYAEYYVINKVIICSIRELFNDFYINNIMRSKKPSDFLQEEEYQQKPPDLKSWPENIYTKEQSDAICHAQAIAREEVEERLSKDGYSRSDSNMSFPTIQEYTIYIQLPVVDAAIHCCLTEKQYPIRLTDGDFEIYREAITSGSFIFRMESSRYHHFGFIKLRALDDKVTKVTIEIRELSPVNYKDFDSYITYKEPYPIRRAFIFAIRELLNEFNIKDFCVSKTRTLPGPQLQQDQTTQRHPGRKSWPEDIWAWEQINIHGQLRKTVRKEWRERLSKERTLADIESSFRHAISSRRPRNSQR